MDYLIYQGEFLEKKLESSSVIRLIILMNPLLTIK